MAFDLATLEPRTVVAGVLCVTLFLLIRAKLRIPSDLPPGPPGHWLFGNTIPTVLYVLSLVDKTPNTYVVPVAIANSRNGHKNTDLFLLSSSSGTRQSS